VEENIQQLPEEERITHIIVGDAPVRNRVQKWLRDVWGLSQDAESGNLVARLLSSNIAALANNIRKLRGHVVLVANHTTANGDQLDEHARQIGDLERRLSYYERNCETIRYAKSKLERITEAERKLAGEPVAEPMCPLCELPIKDDDLVPEALTSMGPLVVHVSCLQERTKPGPFDRGGLVDAGGTPIISDAAETSRSLAHMADVDAEEGQG